MPKRMSLLCCALAGAFALSLAGCQNSHDDGDDYNYDQIGEQRVYDAPKPKRQYVVPPPRSSQIVPQRQQPTVAAKSFDHIGEENVYDQ